MNRTDLRNLFVKSLSASLDKLSIAKNGEQMREIFICPICLQIFNLKECLNTRDIISLEDVPPKSLGGHPLTITCKNCNNSCGHNLDTYLVNEIKSGHRILLSREKEQKITLSNDSTLLQGQFSIDYNKKTISTIVKEENNNPSNIAAFHSDLKMAFESHSPTELKMNFTELKRCPDVLHLSILKNAYLFAFHILGYRYILRSNLDIVRKQILYPQQKILASSPVIFRDEKSLQLFDDGVYSVSIDNQLCIGVKISLKLKEINKVHSFFTVLPDYTDDESRIYTELSKQHEQKVSIIAKFKNTNIDKKNNHDRA